MTHLDYPARHAASAASSVLPGPRTPFPTWAWTGEPDAADVAALSTMWRSLLEERPGSVVIDLSAVTFLDCGVLSVLVRANTDPVTRLLLRGVPARVELVMQLTGLGTAFARAATAGLREAAPPPR